MAVILVCPQNISEKSNCRSNKRNRKKKTFPTFFQSHLFEEKKTLESRMIWKMTTSFAECILGSNKLF